jgi:hypothetical protein
MPFTDAELRKRMRKATGLTMLQICEETCHECMGPAICRECGEMSDFDMEPDQDQGYCEACKKNTVVSGPILEGII